MILTSEGGAVQRGGGDGAELHGHARRYQVEFGIRVIPITAGTKRAAVCWARHRGREPTARTLTRWFCRPDVAGLAAILGAPSRGLAVRDFDDPDAYRRWADARPDLAHSLPTYQTARGFGVCCRLPREAFATLPDGELRGDALHYSILPPSRHPDGPVYRWVVPLRQPLPLVDPFKAGFLPAAVPPTPPVPLPPPTPPLPPPDRTHPYCCGHVPSYGTGKVDESGVVEGLIRRTLPTAHGQRNRRLFDLARGLKGLPANAGAGPGRVEGIVRRWWERALPNVRTKAWAESWQDFLVAWERVRRPGSTGTAEGLREWAFALVPLGNPVGRQEGDLLRLELIAEQLQARQDGRPFPLGERFAAQLLGVSKNTARTAIQTLVRAGKLIPAVPPHRAARRATEYHYAGPTLDGLAPT